MHCSIPKTPHADVLGSAWLAGSYLELLGALAVAVGLGGCMQRCALLARCAEVQAPLRGPPQYLLLQELSDERPRDTV